MGTNKKPTKKNLLFLGSIFFLIVILGIGFFVIKLFLGPVCEFTYSKNIFSSDKRYFLQIVSSDCGATVADQTDVLVYKSKPENKSNFERQDIFSFSGGQSGINVSWKNNNTITIKHNQNCNDILLKKDSWKSIKIIYIGKCEGSSL